MNATCDPQLTISQVCLDWAWRILTGLNKLPDAVAYLVTTRQSLENVSTNIRLLIQRGETPVSLMILSSLKQLEGSMTSQDQEEEQIYCDCSVVRNLANHIITYAGH